MRWRGLSNGALLVRNNDYDLIRPFVPRILDTLQRIAPRELVLIE
jgi:hypothetical protein